MGKLIGLIFVAVGLGFAIEMMPAGFYDRGIALVGHAPLRAAEVPAERLVPAIAPAAANTTGGAVRQPRVFAPSRPLLTNTTPAAGAVPTVSSDPVRTTISSDPTELSRLLQIELRRVGCYTGDIDGSWGAGSKRAMQAFTERANSTLPIDAPDLVLLTLVRNHGTATCSTECAVGQMMSSRGQCVKNPGEVQATTVPGGWRPVVTVENRAVAASQAPEQVRQTTVRRITVAPAPQLVTGPVEAQRGTLPVASTTSREVDWGTRMSVGAAPPAVLPQPPQGVIPTTPQPAALTPPSALASSGTRSARQERPSAQPSPRQVQRPASIDRPRPATNWRRDAFASRN